VTIMEQTLRVGRSMTSEYGRLQEVALCRPVNFAWAAENDIVAQSKLSGKSADVAAAVTQHTEMVSALHDAGVTCHFLSPDPDLPMQTFTRDAAVMTPWGLLMAQMARPERGGEWAAVEALAQTQGLNIWRSITAAPLEGGDVQILRPGEVLIGVNETRTYSAAAQQLAHWVAAEGWVARQIRLPAHFLHLDVLFTVLNDRAALCATEVLAPEDVAWLAERFTLIPVGYRDVMRMGCNVTALGDDRVLSTRQHPDLNARLRALGFAVLDPDLEQFVLEGGGTHCLTMPLARKDP
jgi:arginine deiminase